MSSTLYTEKSSAFPSLSFFEYGAAADADEGGEEVVDAIGVTDGRLESSGEGTAG